MALVQIDNAKLTVGSKLLFKDISFSINDGDRIGLVGNNGCGKSSLVKALIGEYELDHGTIKKRRNLTIGYVSQEIPEAIEAKTCHNYLLESIPEHARDTDFWKADVALNELGLNPDLWHKPVKALSGGWRRLLLIASATLQEPDLLILDEPTNHLDLGKIFKLEQWLKTGINVPYMMVSHDREFLDQCTDRTLFMRQDGIHDFKAPFSTARENLLQADALALRSREREEVEIKRLERAAKRLKEWGDIAPQSDLSKKGEALQTRAEHLKAKQTEVYREKTREIKLHHDEVSSNAVAIIRNAQIATPDGRPLFTIDQFAIKQGDRICIMGLNGAGKSVFIRRMLEELQNYEQGPSHEKKFWYSPQVRLGYLDQHLEQLPENMDVYSFLSDRFNLNHTQTIRELVVVGFPVNHQGVKIGSMSSGEKARLSLLALKLSKPNFYILDEPTNHLDIQGQEALEEELDDKGHTCVFVSHDRRLVRGASTRFLEIKNGKLIEVESPESFFERTQQQLANDEEIIEKKQPAPGNYKAKRGPRNDLA